MSKKYQAVAGLVELITNATTLFSFSYATSVYPLKQLSNFETSFKVEYKIDNSVKKEFFNLLNQNKLVSFLPHIYFLKSFNLKKNKEEIQFYVFHSALFNFVGKILLDFKTKNLIVISNRSWTNLIKFSIWELDPPTKHLNDFLNFLLLKNGYLTMHASAVSDDKNNVTIIMGKPNTGKSISTYFLSKHKGYKLVGDDIIVVDVLNKKVYSCPYAFTFFHNKFLIHQLHKDKVLSTLDTFKWSVNEFLKKIPVIYLFVSFKYSYAPIFSKLKYSPEGNLKNIVLLEKGSNEGVNVLEKSSASKLIKFFNEIEFHWWKNSAIKSLDYFSGRSTFSYLESLEEELINNLLKNSNSFRIVSKNSLSFYKKIDELIRKY